MSSTPFARNHFSFSSTATHHSHFLAVLSHLQAIWDNQFYYLFGFLFLVFIILILSCAEIAIVMTYLQLCSEVRPAAKRAAAAAWNPGILPKSCDAPLLMTPCFPIPLPRKDYHWWWRSFIVSGGSAVYVFLYSAFYYTSKLDIDDSVSTILYFGYTSLMVLVFWILTGKGEEGCGGERK